MRSLDILAALTVVVIWGLNFVVVKIGVAQFPPLFMTALRFAFVAVLLIWLYPPPVGRIVPIAVLAFSFGGFHFGALFSGLVKVDAAVAAIVIQLAVPFSALFAWLFLGDALGWRRGAGMAVAFAGVVVLAGEPATASSLVHAGLILVAAVAWGLGNVQIKRIGRINVFQLNAWMALFAAPQLFVASAVLEDGQMASLAAADWRGWAAVAYTVVAASVTAYGLWYYLVDKYPVSRVIPYTLLAPVIGVAAGVTLLGEALTWYKVLGGLLTIAGVAVVELAGSRTREAAAPVREGRP